MGKCKDDEQRTLEEREMVNHVRAYRTVITDGLLQRWGNVMMTDRACWRGTYMTGLVKSESNGYVAVDMLHNTSARASF